MTIDELKNGIIESLGGDPFSDPTSWDLIEAKLPSQYWPLLIDRSGATTFVEKLPQVLQPAQLGQDHDAQTLWERIGNYYKNQQRFHEAVSIYSALYDQLLQSQEELGKHIHKGAPLVWMSDCFSAIGWHAVAKRYLMLTLCEDAIREEGSVSANTTGTYFRIVWQGGLTDRELTDYARQIYRLHQNHPVKSRFPEWILQSLNKDWMTVVPSPGEAGAYWANTLYVRHMLNKLGDRKGKALENLAEYILSCMPGCRTTTRSFTTSGEIDIVCSMDGIEADFRSELGRYFVCECKDWKKAADFTSVAKFCRVLDSIKAKFGILFSPKGLSGQKGRRYAANEPQKLFQNNGIVLVVIDETDLNHVANGGNFVNLLRNKYETVRLDLPTTTVKPSSS